ncbi:cupin domain-containing protein [Xinfangfangia sp. CPCC 101601]|uniref:Cupin domain-containing protein n=1 Tax=Pseudogemmobacter lacusdianii TaxID=3069608 RepID=A0ABU0W276_9RHOB|nr:cupin domain-containing protein [Xinfangfangia sp. CPCC 101601]MDQ2068124.1 cupin domain-containing protein [Xinfangfangia sp. CPCC 101601]
MTNTYATVAGEANIVPAYDSTEGAKSFRRTLWVEAGDEAAAAKAAVWIAEPGTYPFEGRPLDETFVVMEGTAECTVGGGETKLIGAGDIVTIPVGVTIVLKILTPFRKVAFVVPKV